MYGGAKRRCLLLYIEVGNMKNPKFMKSKDIKGFTMIEMILYIALVSIFVTGAILFVWDVIYGREKAYNQQIVDLNAKTTVARLAYEIRRAKSITTAVGSNLVLVDESGATTTVSMVSGAVEITSGGLGPYKLTSNDVSVTGLTFSDLSSADLLSKNVSVSLSLAKDDNIVDLEESVELNSQFNTSRSILIDGTLSSLSVNGRDLSGISIQNTGNTAITVTDIIITWSGGTQTETTDYTLPVGPSVTSINTISFGTDMNNVPMQLKFITNDNSSSLLSLTATSLGATPIATPTSTPTPTTTPVPTSCLQVCQNNNFTQSACRQNAQQCVINNEIYISSGNIFCTGGASADTCCCK